MKNNLKTNCYFYYEDIDMGAHVPNCKKTQEYDDCENYISIDEVRALVEKELMKRKLQTDSQKPKQKKQRPFCQQHCSGCNLTLEECRKVLWGDK